MTKLTIFISFFVLFTKYLDCITTLQRIENPYQEQNRLVRVLMIRYGIRKVVWGVMGLSVIVVSSSMALLLTVYDNLLMHLGYIITGLIISAIQVAVAHHNHSGKANRITSFIAKWAIYR